MGKIKIDINVEGEKVETDIKSDNPTISDLAVTISQLDLYRLQLLSQLKMVIANDED